jgi:hypothetical protein
MSRIESAPFLRISSARIVAGAWIDTQTGSPLAMTGVDGWDPSVDLDLTRDLEVDVDGARHDAGLADGDQLTCGATWYCPTTTLRGAGPRFEVSGQTAAARIRLEIPGTEVGGRLTVRTQIVLASSRGNPTSLAATIPGSVLWEDSTFLPLEGTGSRFPMEWLDFSESGWLPDGAGWYLEWSPDEPEAPALGAIRLYLNQNHEAVRAAVTAGAPEPQQQAIREMIQYDVARSLILGALGADPETWDEAASEQGSVASVVNRLLSVVFPTETMDGLRARRVATPQRLEVKLQDGLRLFRDLTMP